MGEHQRHPNSNSKALEKFENLITEKVTKSVRESIGGGLRGFLEPFEQAGYNRSTHAIDKVNMKN